MKVFTRILRRPSYLAAVAETLMGSSLMAMPSSSNCGIGMGLTRNWSRSATFHVPVKWSSTAINGSACPDPSPMMREIAEYGGQLVQNHPQIMEFATYSSMMFFTYYVLPRIVMQFSYKSTNYGKYHECFQNAVANTEKKIMKFYPLASIGLITFCEMCIIISPSTEVLMSQLWRGASVVSVIWFFNLLKENFIVEAKRNGDQELRWLSHFDKVSSLTLIALGVLGVAEAADISLESIVTISGAGGVLTAFAARDIIGNMLNGFSLQLSQPFRVGEYIKAGSVEGTVAEIGLICTLLINQEKLPVTVPNSYFFNQVIVNRSRATVRSYVIKIPIKIDDAEKILVFTREVSLMLKTNTLLILKAEGPSCYVSRVGKLYGEMVISFDTPVVCLKNEGLIDIEQHIMLESLKILKSNGIEVGDPLPSADFEALLEAANIIKSHNTSYTG